MVTQFRTDFLENVSCPSAACAGLIVVILILGSCILPLDAQPIVPLERSFEGEASYEIMKQHWPPAGREWTALSPKNARTKFRVSATELRTYVKAWPPDPGHKDMGEYNDHTMTVRFGAGDPPQIADALPLIDYRLMRGYLNAEEWQDFTHDTVIVPSEVGERIALTAQYREEMNP